MAQERPVVFLMGPTAIGKTALSIQLAHRLGAEIISVDSALVYRGFDIGTAKPTMNERQGIPHHLIDICDPAESYSAARFCEDASRLIAEIRSRDALPLLAGGTMLYFNALQHGLADLPAADDQVRAALLDQAQEQGWSALHEELRRVDPASAERIHPNDPQRIQRALEVHRVSGRSLSDWHREKRTFLKQAPVKLAMQPLERRWLHQRIDQRFDQMLELGFLDEVRHLRKEPGLNTQLPAVRSVGYRQAWEHLDACDARSVARESPDHPLPDNDSTWHDRARAATRQLAKRQLTWLRGMPDAHVVDCGEPVTAANQMERAMSVLNRG